MLLYADFDFNITIMQKGTRKGQSSYRFEPNVAPSLNVWLLKKHQKLLWKMMIKVMICNLTNYKEAYEAMFEYDDMEAQLISLDYFNNYFEDVEEFVGSLITSLLKAFPAFKCHNL